MFSTHRFVSAFLVAAFVAAPSFAQSPPRIPPGVKVLRDIEYAAGGGKSRSLDLYLPEKAGVARPLIVWIHGGAWRAGSKSGNPMVRLMEAGFATASIEYRFSQVAKFPAQIEDCKAAIRFLRAHAKEYGIDPDRIGVSGSSAGGHLAALLGTAGDIKDFDRGENLEFSSRVQAVCDLFGPSNLLTMGAQSNSESRIQHDAADSPESNLVGGPLQERKVEARAASPVTYVNRDDPPFLILHGDNDPLVPLAQSEELLDALKKHGVESRLFVIAGGGHGGAGFNAQEPQAMIREFFVKHLQPAREPAPAP